MGIKGKIDRNTVILGDFNTSLISMDRSSRQKINKETVALNDILDQMDLIDIFRAFHPTTAEHTFFSNAHAACSRINHMSQYVLRRLKSQSSIFSDHNGMKLQINYKNKNCKTEKHVEAK